MGVVSTVSEGVAASAGAFGAWLGLDLRADFQGVGVDAVWHAGLVLVFLETLHIVVVVLS